MPRRLIPGQNITVTESANGAETTGTDGPSSLSGKCPNGRAAGMTGSRLGSKTAG